MGKFIDLTGQKFGRLTAIERADNNKHGNVMWICSCECGSKTVALGTSLRNGQTKSCGCKKLSGINRYGKTHNFKTEKQRRGSGIRFNRENNWVEETMLCSLGRKRSRNNSTGINGVSWCNTYKKYVASIRFQKQLIFLGRYDKLQDAAKARKEAEEKYFKPILEKYNRLPNE